MKILAALFVVLCCLVGVPATAQLADPNDAGVSMGHLHYRVRDVEANRKFWIALGGQPVKGAAGVEIIRFPDVLVFLERGESSGGTEGAVVNHVAFRVPSLAPVEAAGLKVTRLQGFPGVASVMTPEGERIELFENAATNLTFTFDGERDTVAERHNRPLERPIAFHHIHLYLPDAAAVAAAKAWYVRMFGGIPGKRSQYDAVDLPGINLNISANPRPAVPLKHRMLDHIGFEVSGLEAFCKRLEGMGITFDVPYSTTADGIGSAFLIDPWGTHIELTEGLRRY